MTLRLMKSSTPSTCRASFRVLQAITAMADTPNTIGRKSDGTFAEGNSLGGRKHGARNKTTLAVEALLEGEHEALTRAAIKNALEGDTTALRLCLDRIAPVRKDSPVTFDLPKIETAKDALKASAALLAAVAAGEVTPDEAGRVMALLTSHRALVETSDLANRIEALEEARK